MQKRIRDLRLLATTLTLAASLVACGGYTTVPLGGTVFGLTNEGLVLANGDDRQTIHPGDTSYRFAKEIDDHGTYAITIASMPVGQTCAVASASGSATGVAITWANVVCSVNTHTITAKVTGLTAVATVEADALKLTNGSDTVSVDTNRDVQFPGRVAEGAYFGVTVLQQPKGQACTVTNGTQQMGKEDVANIQVTCQ